MPYACPLCSQLKLSNSNGVANPNPMGSKHLCQRGRIPNTLPFVYAPTILALSIDYEHAVETCCARTDIGACHCPKGRIDKIHTYNCRILKTFGERIFKADTLASISQKYPKAPFAEICKTAEDISDEHKECCDGDMVECMDDRTQIVEHICSNQEVFSSKIRECCEKPLVEKCQCVVQAEFHDKPTDLPPIAEKYIQDPDVFHLYLFLYDYSRRHQGFSTPMLLRIAKQYEDLLEKCCKTEDSSQCYGKVVGSTIHSHNRKKTVFRYVGSCDFRVLIRYTKKMPQVSTETMLEVGKKIILAGVKCCQEPENRRIACAEGYVSRLLFLSLQKAVSVNDQVAHCCSASYANRRPCFTKWPVLIMFCSHSRLLVNLIKCKPSMTDEQLGKIIAGFIEMVDKCCKKEDHDACFGEEGANLIVESRATLGIEV
uniref:Albumin domain-containing protein n=1 Tax=Crocodylus porosus TaxID=8502 RepID=A0A7M4EHS6_CROPO